MKTTLFKTVLCAGVVGTLLGSCTNDDLYDPSATVKKYENAWEKQFGKVDPNQTWNTATRVTANVDLGSVTGDYTLKIYTANPINADAYLLAKTPINDKASIAFDVPISTNYAYATVEGDEGLIMNGYYLISDGVMKVSQSNATTRAEVCNTTVGKEVKLGAVRHPEGGQYGWGDRDCGSIFYLNNVKKNVTAAWKFEDFKPIVGPGAVFAEGINNREKWKEQLGTKVEYTMLSEGPVSFSLMYGGTQYYDQFGYFYYMEDDLKSQLNAKRYVLMDDARPYTNILCEKEAPHGMDLPTWINSDNHNEHMVTGTEYHLVYFDENGNASYNFPKGIHIAFFIIKAADSENNNESDVEENQANNFNYRVSYSLPEINAYYAKYYNSDTKEGDIVAVTYNYGKTTCIGFEDNTYGDKDMNDILFFATGNFEKPEDIAPDPTPEPVANPWILACEDLGSTDDFDFNDIVFSVSHVSGETTATVTPLAAGGTLPAYICFNDKELGEIHQLLGGSSTSEFINTNGSKGTAGNPITINVDKNFSMASNNMGGFSVKVIAKDNTEATVNITAPGQGAAPQMICVPGEWTWPTERTNISDAYPAFGEWGANYATNKDWYKNPNGGVVK